MTDLALPREVADYLLTECRKHGERLTNRQLQLLVYYAQARFLGIYGRQLFDENCEARALGPVVVSQFDRFSVYRAQPITCDVPRPILSSKVQMHLDGIIERYGADECNCFGVKSSQRFALAGGAKRSATRCTKRDRHFQYTMRDFYRAMGRDMHFAGEQRDEQRLAYPLGLWWMRPGSLDTATVSPWSNDERGRVFDAT